LSELEFNFKLSPENGHCNLNHIFGEYLKREFSLSSPDGVIRNICDGFMNGFIDLVFRQNSKYYILDWKSNKLNGTAAGFDQSGMKREMSQHYYFLQYLIYTVALHRFLSSRQSDYDYDRDFGGVYYIFLRGVNGENNNGIFFTRPEYSLINQLDKHFGGLG
jgi:exodeoxyribonuclease V beta subunit